MLRCERQLKEIFDKIPILQNSIRNVLLFFEFCCHVHIQEADYFEKIIEFDKNKFVKRILKKLDRSDTFELMIRLKLISKWYLNWQNSTIADLETLVVIKIN